MDPNERATRSWLASQEKPWLLIIDNADDDQTELDRYFPGGERGHILITTRNPSHKIYGTMGNRFFDFSSWESEAATSLLLKAADEPLPWTRAVEEVASRITKALGYLPLALIVAGKTITKGVCSLREYLAFYENSWKRMRHQARRNVLAKPARDDTNPHLRIYATCEVMHFSLQNEHSQAASDAVELLNLFSFLHRENISVDLLVQGATNPKKERQEAAKQQSQDLSWTKKPWPEKLQWLRLAALAIFFPEQTRPVLPDCLQINHEYPNGLDIWRLREALAELSQRSLIMFHADKDSYSLHPIVHIWVRERPTMKTTDQAIWCQAAATILAQAILLPPLAGKNSDENFRRDLLPHVAFMRQCKADITAQFARNQAERKVSWLPVEPVMTRTQALAMAKYSVVFAQCGQWQEAESLQVKVRDFVQAALGLQHPSTIRIQLALADTYWQQGRGTEAADLQAAALESCSRKLGKRHQRTLTVMDALAVSRWMQGRYKEAQALGEAAVDGLSSAVGLDHEDTLRAKDHLGRVHSKYWRFEQARQLHQTAVRGLTARLGADHLDTLTAKDSLAMAYYELDNNQLELAQKLEEEVVGARHAKLGKEHPYTLLSVLSLARIKAARGELQTAEEEIRRGLLVAYRNLGADHIGVLCARMHLGDVLARGGRLAEADDELRDVIERQKRMPSSHRGVHPDCLMAMYIRADCLRARGRYAEGAALLEEAMQGLSDIGGNEHLFMQKLRDRRRLLLLAEENNEPEFASNCNSETAPVFRRPIHAITM